MYTNLIKSYSRFNITGPRYKEWLLFEFMKSTNANHCTNCGSELKHKLDNEFIKISPRNLNIQRVSLNIHEC